jgi:predicted dehydrogenase
MLEKTVGVAVTGLGFVGGQAHVPAVKKIEGAELIAVIDVKEELAKNVAAKYDVKYYTDFNKALEDPKIEALIISVPTPFHYNLSSKAIAHGKHVMCEIPLTPDIADAYTLKDQAKKAGVILMPDLNFHFVPNYVKAKELIDQGAIGEPIALTFSESIAAKDMQAQWPAGSWAWNAEKSGGYPDFTLSQWGIDLIRWLVGREIEEVEWMCNYAPLEGFGKFTGYNTAGIVRFSNEAVGVLHYSSTVARGEGASRLEVFGSNTKAIRANWNNSLTLTAENETEKKTWSFDAEAKGTKSWGHRQIDQHFVNCVLRKEKPVVTVDDAVKVQSIANKMVRNNLVERLPAIVAR